MRSLLSIFKNSLRTITAIIALIFVCVYVASRYNLTGYLAKQLLANDISEYLGTEVTVENADVDIFNQVVLEQLLVKDLESDTLLFARRAKVSFDLLPLLNNKLVVHSIQFIDFDINLSRKDSLSDTYVRYIIKAGTLSSNDGSSYWNLESGEVVLRAYATTASVEEQTNRIDNIEEQKMYRLVISSSNGNIFKNGNISTVLTATVFSWDKDVTDELDDNQFIWTRVSSDTEADKAWNSAHFGGTKSITITNDDVKARATFYCDLIDTSTRESLLG